MITDNIRAITQQFGSSKPTLIAVSKQQADHKINAALAAGLRIFGENRAQEAQTRWSSRRPTYPDLQLHLIGSLQTNKVADAVALFDVIHTLDREKLAITLQEEMIRQQRNLPCFIQVNTGNEPQKSGVSVPDLPAFYDFCIHDCHLTIQGLMCIPPVNEPSSLHFGLLADWARRLNLPSLSMGMSNDYAKALQYGATHIRVGTAIFGERHDDTKQT